MISKVKVTNIRLYCTLLELLQPFDTLYHSLPPSEWKGRGNFFLCAVIKNQTG